MGLLSAGAKGSKNAVKGLLDAMDLSDKDYYHGTASDIQEFSKGFRGSGTDAASAKKAFWFSDDPEYTARSYAAHSATTNRVAKLLKEADEAERAGNWDLYDKKLTEAEDLEQKFMNDPSERMKGQNIIPVYLPKDTSLKVIDMQGQSFNDEGVSELINKTLDQAKDDGFKGVKFLNLDDAVGHHDKPATHVAVFDESNIRSKFAKLDSSKAGEAGMMKSGFLPTTGSGLLAMYALSPDDARAVQIAATDTRDVGSIQAARNPRLQRIAGLLGSIDTPMGSLFESTPNVLNRWAYGEEADTMDKLGMALELMP